MANTTYTMPIPDDDGTSSNGIGGWLDGMQSLLGVGPRDDRPDHFASWLPYLSYAPDDGIFVNRDTIGFLLEVMPQSGGDQTMADVMKSIFPSCPAQAGVQFHLLASPHLRDTLRRYASLRVEDADHAERTGEQGRPARNSNVYRALARRRVAHFLEGAQRSLAPGYHFTIRNFRLLISVCLPGTIDQRARINEAITLRDSISATLRAAELTNEPRGADELINWCALFTNADRLFQRDPAWLHYDDGRAIRDQIIDRDTVQEATPYGLRVGRVGHDDEMEVRFYSIKSFPETYPLWDMGALIGDMLQPALQYPCPFLITMGVHVPDPTGSRTSVTANHWRATQNARSSMSHVMPDVQKKLDDWNDMAQAIDQGGTAISMYHQVALFTRPDKALRAEEAVKALWRGRGFELNNDVYMHRQALLASLPMMLSPALFADLRREKRTTRKKASNAVHLAPLIAEWRGTNTPTLLLAGRRGQVMTLDMFDNVEGNYSAAVVGSPGGGKSVLLNEFAWSYSATGAKVWILDLGRSFEKLCRKVGGQYIEFKPETVINLNPFSYVVDINEDMDLLHPVICKMASMSQTLEEVQSKAINKAIVHCWNQYGRETTITTLQSVFKAGVLPDFDGPVDQRICDLALMLEPYTRSGVYARYFEGRANVDFTNDFVVIENEELKRKPDLHAVINMLLLNRITGEMYLTRNRKKLLIIDELKQQLGDIGADDPIKAAVVEEAARRARKYGGSLITATQQADDYYGSRQMEAAFQCSDWLFILRNKKESIEQLHRHGKIVMDENKKRMLNSLRLEPGAFSEMYIYSPVGEGVARLVLDPYTRLLFSNRLEDNKPIDERLARGMSIDEAIADVLRERGTK